MYNKSHIGLVRATNEDSMFVKLPHLFMVADGMGGHSAGEIASKLAVDVISRYVEANIADCYEPQQILQQAITAANKEIFQQAEAHPEYAGMGTTATVVYADEHTLSWGHVGDSRIYLYNGQELSQLTSDHSLVAELYRSGRLTREEAINHPNKNILTRAVGTDNEITVDTGGMSWDTGDMLLLCSDGLTNMLSDEKIAAMLVRVPIEGQAVVEDLIAAANAAGGRDNITAVLVWNAEAAASC